MSVRFKKSFKVQAIETPLFEVGGSVEKFILNVLAYYPLKEKSVLAVTSKIFSLAENQIAQAENKESLIKSESDHYIGKGNYDFHLTIKDGLLMPSAGIDQSNSPQGDLLLLPKDPYLSLEKLWKNLQSHWKKKHFGLLMTDSHTMPFRRGVIGVGLAHWGFKAVTDCRGQKDLFGRELKVTTINNLDALAASAVWAMGEGGERCPIALIEGASLDWSQTSHSQEICIPLKEDLYEILFRDKIKNHDG